MTDKNAIEYLHWRAYCSQEKKISYKLSLKRKDLSTRRIKETPNRGAPPLAKEGTKKGMTSPAKKVDLSVKDMISFEDVEAVQYFVDFLRDDEFDDDGAQKIYEIGGTMPFLRDRVESFIRS